MSKNSVEYIVKAKKTRIEYEISRKFNFELLIDSIIYILLISSLIFLSKSNIIGLLLYVIVILGCFAMVIKDSISKLRKIKIANNCIIINNRKKEYKFTYDNLIKIRVRKTRRDPSFFEKYYLYIYYLKDDEIEEFKIIFPRQALEKIEEICEIFITNYNIEKLNESEYLDVRSKEKDEIINKVFNDEIIW